MTPRPADEARRALREARDLTGAGKDRAAATGEDVDIDADAVTDAVTEPGIGEDAPVMRSPEQARARVADPDLDSGPDSGPGPGPERDRDGVHDREPSGRRDGQEPGGAPERDPGPQPGRERAQGWGPSQGEEHGHGPHVAQGRDQDHERRDQDHARGRGGVLAQDEAQADGEAQARATDHGPGGSRPPGQGQGRDEERGEGAERSGPRPGDIAREALRNARTARRATGQPDAPSGALSAPPGEREAEDDRSEEGTRPARQVTPDGTAVTEQTDGSGRSGRAADARPGPPDRLLRDDRAPRLHG
ncbi:hypothetical protein K3A88_35650, partial [Streptomyces geysiriensis]|nr:hypothetical protein [Streptomyces geysiriensis]